MSSPVHIISTRKLEAADVNAMGSVGLRVTHENYISKKIRLPEHLNKESFEAPVLLTSKTAVAAFVQIIQKLGLDKKKIKVFCLAAGTKQTALDNGLEPEGYAADAEALADLIINTSMIKKVTFVCGNLRLDVLPARLQSNEVVVEEIVAYTTDPTPIKIESVFQAVMFYSPSAIDSFLSVNTVQDAVAFCIGNTTAAHARKSGFDKIQVANWHTPEALTQTVIDYYKNQIVHA